MSKATHIQNQTDDFEAFCESKSGEVQHLVYANDVDAWLATWGKVDELPPPPCG
jgi:hypothetical protein